METIPKVEHQHPLKLEDYPVALMVEYLRRWADADIVTEQVAKVHGLTAWQAQTALANSIASTAGVEEAVIERLNAIIASKTDDEKLAIENDIMQVFHDRSTQPAT